MSKINEEKKTTVSVIVPIYNVEKYLRQCLDSIVGQTLSNLEIILINDGSKDGSLEIINEYAKKDNRIKVINKENEGYGKTINRGIEAASSEYIGIVESDDWIEPDMFEILYGIAKQHNVDVVKSKFILFDNQTLKEWYPSPWIPQQDEEQIINPIKNPAIFYVQPSIWSAIYRREFLNKNNIRFLETPGASFQDTSFNFKVWAMAETVYITPKPMVHYRLGLSEQSAKNKDKIFCVCDEFDEVERYMASNPELFVKIEKIFNRAKYNASIWNFSRLEGENQDLFHNRMQAEFTPILKRNAIDLFGMKSKNRLELLKTVFPKKFSKKIKFLLKNLSWLLKYYWRDAIAFSVRPIKYFIVNPVKSCFISQSKKR